MDANSTILSGSSNSSSILSQAFALAKIPILISFIITPVRFGLELAGIPDKYVFLIGLLWLTLAFGIYWGVKLKAHRFPYLLLLLGMMIYSPISRIPVFILWWITKTWNLGTHYDIFDGWQQALIGQLFYGALIQIIPGFILGSITLYFASRQMQSKN